MSVTIYLHWTPTPYKWVRSGALCRVLEFADELGISATYEPFRLLERRGG